MINIKGISFEKTSITSYFAGDIEIDTDGIVEEKEFTIEESTCLNSDHTEYGVTFTDGSEMEFELKALILFHFHEHDAE